MRNKKISAFIIAVLIGVIFSSLVVSSAASPYPSDVKGFKLKSIGSHTAELVWTSQKGVSGYVVYQSTNGSKFKVIGKKNYNGKCIVKNLNANSNYKFAVKAYKNVNGISYLSKKYPVVKANTMPATVKNLKVHLSENRAYLEWKASKGAAGYYIYYSTDSGKHWTEYGCTTKTAFRKKELKSGTTYLFAVKVYKNVNGKMIISRDMSKIKSSTVPQVPPFTCVKKDSKYTLKWQKINGASEYIVYSKLPGKSWVKKGVTKNTEYSFEQNAKELFVTVKAVRIVGKQKFASDYWERWISSAKPSGKIATFGDSVAKGIGSHRYTYADMFARKNNLKLYNYTVSGAELCSAIKSDSHICQQVVDTVKKGADYDYILIQGGRNDYYYNCKLGSVSPEGTSKFNMNTVCGALEAAFYHIREVNPSAKVIFVIMHDAAGQSTKKNGLGLTFNDYVNAFENVCEKYGVVPADCYHTGLKTADTSISEKFTYHYFGVFPTGDGVHPSQQAYELFYLPQIEYSAEKSQPIGNSLPETPEPEAPKPEEPEPDDFDTDIVEPYL